MLEVVAPIAFALALLLIATDWVHRTIIVFAGSAAFVLTGVLDQQQAFEAIDLETLGLLIGMMVIVSITERTGIFEQLAIVAMRIARGRPLAVVLTTTALTAGLSAFLDNLTAILLVAPITIIVAGRYGMPPAPLLIMQILASNIGGTATLVGDPPNIMIAGATGLSFNAFLINLAPVAFVVLVAVTLLMYALHRTKFVGSGLDVTIDDIQPEAALASGRSLWIPLGILIGTIVAFFLHGLLHLEPSTIALTGATAMLMTGLSSIDEALDSVDWPTIFFFAGLFVMVGGLREVGFIDAVAAWTKDLTGGSRTAELMGILGLSAAGSAVVDNIPFTAAMIPVVDQLSSPGDDAHWWALSLGACFGGNATIIAAAANVACQGVAERNGVTITFREFLYWGVPATIVSLMISAGYLLLFHA